MLVGFLVPAASLGSEINFATLLVWCNTIKWFWNKLRRHEPPSSWCVWVAMLLCVCVCVCVAVIQACRMLICGCVCFSLFSLLSLFFYLSFPLFIHTLIRFVVLSLSLFSLLSLSLLSLSRFLYLFIHWSEFLKNVFI